MTKDERDFCLFYVDLYMTTVDSLVSKVEECKVFLLRYDDLRLVHIEIMDESCVSQ